MMKNISPTKRRKTKRKTSKKSGPKRGKTAQRDRFRRAAKKCKGKSLKAFRACMKRELKKR